MTITKYTKLYDGVTYLRLKQNNKHKFVMNKC